ncbi:hypothetical protein HanPSC8_Chr01g0032801 [Helianthus annuus]|nr:hypothetical protein HanPSC8_Chr01g0032801 [Helianthus annuus]
MGNHVWKKSPVQSQGAIDHKTNQCQKDSFIHSTHTTLFFFSISLFYPCLLSYISFHVNTYHLYVTKSKIWDVIVISNQPPQVSTKQASKEHLSFQQISINIAEATRALFQTSTPYLSSSSSRARARPHLIIHYIVFLLIKNRLVRNNIWQSTNINRFYVLSFRPYLDLWLIHRWFLRSGPRFAAK